MLSESQQRSGVSPHYATRLLPVNFNCKDLIYSRFSYSKSCLIFSNYVFSVFFKYNVKTVVNILYPVHSNDIPLQFLHCSLSFLILYIGTIMFVV
jgi:hypothetical protein